MFQWFQRRREIRWTDREIHRLETGYYAEVCPWVKDFTADPLYQSLTDSLARLKGNN